jgi:hypothetical protein
MVHFDSQAAQILIYFALAVAAILLLIVGFQVGKLAGAGRHQRELEATQKDLFTTQTGFKKLYENEIVQLKTESERLKAENDTLTARVEDYRKKAAGFGGLFGGGGKKADAMYALLLENEALEEALHKQNAKMSQERTDAVQESMRNIGYRRVLMSQLLNDTRIKEYVKEVIEDGHRLPSVEHVDQPRLPS